jgi:FAD binding domain
VKTYPAADLTIAHIADLFDVLRMFQEVGCIDEIWPSTQFLPVFDLFRNGGVLLSSPVLPRATHGWPEYISIYQPAFEKELDRLAKAEPSVEVFQGETVTAIAQDAESITATAIDDIGNSRQIRGRYLIGADGGNSIVREALGVAYESRRTFASGARSVGNSCACGAAGCVPAPEKSSTSKAATTSLWTSMTATSSSSGTITTSSARLEPSTICRSFCGKCSNNSADYKNRQKAIDCCTERRTPKKFPVPGM